MKLVEQKSDSKVVLLESKKREGKYIGRIKLSSFVEVGKMNKNERIYSKDILESAIAKLKGKLPIPGNLEHPQKSGGDLQSISHDIDSIQLKGKLGEATANILNTTSGKDLLALLKSNIKIGSSMRGVGSVSSDGEVEEGYQLLSIDLVMTPSYENQIALEESELDNRIKNMVEKSIKQKKQERNEDRKHEQLLEDYAEACSAGFSGSLSDYKKFIEKE